MKKLPQQIIEKISDFEIESDVALPGFALEKDYFVLEAIKLIQGFKTCLFNIATSEIKPCLSSASVLLNSTVSVSVSRRIT